MVLYYYNGHTRVRCIYLCCIDIPHKRQLCESIIRMIEVSGHHCHGGILVMSLVEEDKTQKLDNDTFVAFGLLYYPLDNLHQRSWHFCDRSAL